MQRTQISLTERQAQRLRRVAAERGVSMATLIREAVEAYVPDDEPARRARVERALRAESFTSGLADVSARHDDYLAEDPRGW
jgi:metal-responsive CopG/Arc/MetJ family transcriptional regulator